MMRSILLLGGRLKKSPVVRSSGGRTAQQSKEVQKIARHRVEREAEKQFLRLIATSRLRRQHQIAQAARRVLATAAENLLTLKRGERYAKNRALAKAELAAVAKEKSQQKKLEGKRKSAPALRTETIKKRAERQLQIQARKEREKSIQKAKEERFFATLRRQKEQREARIKKLADNQLKAAKKMEALKSKTLIQQQREETKAAAAKKSEEAENRFYAELQERQAKREAQVEALVAEHLKLLNAREEVPSSPAGEDSPPSVLPSQPMQRELDPEKTAPLKRKIETAVHAETSIEKAVADALATPPSATLEPSSSRPLSRKSKKTEPVEEPASIESSPSSGSAALEEAASTAAETIEETLERSPALRQRGKSTLKVKAPTSSPRKVSVSKPETVFVEHIPAVEESVTAAPVSTDASKQTSRSVAINPEELESVHEEFVAQLEKAKERTVNSTGQSAPAAGAAATSTLNWMNSESTTGLFRL